jgi:uncharacterized protein (TIGR02271 family)
MALYKLDDFYPNYRDELFDGNDIKGLDVYTERDEKVGSIHNVLVDDKGQFRYLVIDTGFWIFGKKVLLPVGRFRSDPRAQRIYTIGLSKEQAQNLPEYHDDMTVDYNYEERVRGVYRAPRVESQTPLEASAPLETSAALEDAYIVRQDTHRTAQPARAAAYTQENYRYEHEPELYGMNERDHQTLRLYEERLVAHKHRQKTGEVSVGKRVTTDTARVSVPVERERIVIERSNPGQIGRAVNPGDTNFREGEVARMEVYEETADVHKEAFVRDQVNIRKEVEHDTVNAQDKIRREELDINTQGNPRIDGNPGNPRR